MPCPHASSVSLPTLTPLWLAWPDPASFTSWLPGLGEEGWGGSGWEEFGPSPSLGLRGGRGLACRQSPFVWVAVQSSWSGISGRFLHLKNNCIVWGAQENPNPSQTCQAV